MLQLLLVVMMMMVWGGPAAASAASAQSQRGSASNNVPSAPASDSLTVREIATMTLQHAVAIRRSEQDVVRQSGALRAASEPFRPQVDLSITADRSNRPVTTASSSEVGTGRLENQTSYRLGVQKTFRNGIAVATGVDANRTHRPTTDAAAINTAGADVEVDVPLLQGRGARVTQADERSARQTYRATRLEYANTQAQTLLDATRAYWRYWEAERTFAIRTEAVERARRVAQQTKTLVDAHERPEADARQARANLADQRSARLTARQSREEARRDLAQAIGLAPGDAQHLAPPATAIPRPDGTPLPSAEDVDVYIDRALDRRADLEALDHRTDAARDALAGARDALRPEVDLSVSVGYTGVDEGLRLDRYVTPLGSNVPGASVSLGLVYRQPVSRRADRGRVAQSEATLTQRRIDRTDLLRRIRSNVHVSAEALRTGASSVRQSQTAVDLYRQAVADERKKFELGMSTLLDVLNVQDRLTQARLNQVSALRRYATAIVRFRYETGRLLDDTGEGERPLLRLDPDALTTLPARP